MIFVEPRDPRFITFRRGGTLSDANHRLLAVWAATCAEHVRHIFEDVSPSDDRLRQALEQNRAWVRGEVTMRQALKVSAARAAARDASGGAKFAAYAAAQAVAVAHVAAHELGAAAYAIRAIKATVDEAEREQAGRDECRWQREQLPDQIRELVLDDQRLRNHVCWFVFDC
jgi:immunity protein 5 of polymorphic toxin system